MSQPKTHGDANVHESLDRAALLDRVAPLEAALRYIAEFQAETEADAEIVTLMQAQAAAALAGGRPDCPLGQDADECGWPACRCYSPETCCARTPQ